MSTHSKTYFKLAQESFEQEQWDNVINYYHKVLQLNPEVPAWVYSHMGVAYAKKRELDKAINLYIEAIRTKPGVLNFHLALARLYSDSDQYDNAIQQYRKVLEIKPDLHNIKPDLYISILKGLGDVYEKNLDFNDAINIHKMILKIKPDMPDSYSSLAGLYSLKKEHSFAIDYYRKAILVDLNKINFKLHTYLTRELILSETLADQRKKYRVNIILGCGQHSDSFFLRGFLPLHRDNVNLFLANSEFITDLGSFFYIVNSATIHSIKRAYCKLNGIKHFIEEIPERVKACLSKGSGYIILDTSNEGPIFSDSFIFEIYDIASTLKISASQIIWMNQNITMSNYHNVLVSNQEFDKRGRIKFLYWHAFLVSFTQKLKALYPSNEKKDNHISYFLRHENIRQKHFLCFNNAARPSRVFILLNLVQNNILQKGLVSFRSMKKNRKLNFNIVQSLYEKLFPNYIYLLDNLDTVEAMLPLTVDSSGDSHQNELVSNFDPEPYTRTYFSVVTESEMTWGETRRFTEKVFKPILNFHPFIVAGNPGTLSLLREMGFKTFNGFFDESYDEIKNPEERALHVIKEVNHLCLMPIEQVHEMYIKMLPTLTYNAEHLLNYIPVWIRDIMGREILYQLRTYAKIQE